MKVLKHSRLERTSLLHRNKRDFWLCMNSDWHHPNILNVRKQFFVLFCFVLFLQEAGWALLSLIGMLTNLSNANIRVSSWLLKGNVWLVITRMYGMQSHFKKENEVVLSYRWHFQDRRRKGMGTEWDKEVVGKVGPQKRVLCLAQVFLRCWTAFANGV